MPARLTPQSLPARLHASRPHATHSGTIATGQATVSTSILPHATVQHRSSQQSPSVRLQSPVGSGTLG
nr:hypothetical protein Iba_chr10bCG4650 [Ipomoea batatas]